MKASFVALALSVLSAVSAAPAKRQSTDIDATILQYALTLEHLENTFYAEALSRFDEKAFTDAGVDSSVRSRIQQIGGHEKSHVEFLSAGLTAAGATPTKACQYDFMYKDVKSFLATAAVLEGVGVSAYLGAAALITNPDYLTAAASIYGVEARHASYVRNTIKTSPFPSAYEVPLDFNQVYSLASAFITSCPESNPALPVKAFPALTAAVQGDAAPGGMVKLSPAKGATDGKGKIYAAFIGFGGAEFGEWDPKSMTVTIPHTASGQTYVVLTTSMDAVTDDNTIAGPAIVEVMA